MKPGVVRKKRGRPLACVRHRVVPVIMFSVLLQILRSSCVAGDAQQEEEREPYFEVDVGERDVVIPPEMAPIDSIARVTISGDKEHPDDRITPTVMEEEGEEEDRSIPWNAAALPSSGVEIDFDSVLVEGAAMTVEQTNDDVDVPHEIDAQSASAGGTGRAIGADESTDADAGTCAGVDAVADAGVDDDFSLANRLEDAAPQLPTAGAEASLSVVEDGVPLSTGNASGTTTADTAVEGTTGDGEVLQEKLEQNNNDDEEELSKQEQQEQQEDKGGRGGEEEGRRQEQGERLIAAGESLGRVGASVDDDLLPAEEEAFVDGARGEDDCVQAANSGDDDDDVDEDDDNGTDNNSERTVVDARDSSGGVPTSGGVSTSSRAANAACSSGADCTSSDISLPGAVGGGDGGSSGADPDAVSTSRAVDESTVDGGSGADTDATPAAMKQRPPMSGSEKGSIGPQEDTKMIDGTSTVVAELIDGRDDSMDAGNGNAGVVKPPDTEGAGGAASSTVADGNERQATRPTRPPSSAPADSERQDFGDQDYRSEGARYANGARNGAGEERGAGEDPLARNRGDGRRDKRPQRGRGGEGVGWGKRGVSGSGEAGNTDGDGSGEGGGIESPPRGLPEELTQRMRDMEAELSRKRKAEEDAKSLLDLWAEKARHFVLTRTVPPTDAECDFNWSRLRCEPKCLCAARLRFGDYTPGRTCRLLSHWERQPECESAWDPSDEPAVRRLAAGVAWVLGSAKRAYEERIAPPSDPECSFRLGTRRCEPQSQCRLRFRWGDLTLDSACRLAREEKPAAPKPAGSSF